MSTMPMDTETVGHLLANIDQQKRDKLRDIIRRTIANPQNLDEVVEEVAADWFPMVKVDPTGKLEIVVGSGRKR